MTEKLYKVLNADGNPFHGGSGRWHLPADDGPGEWMPTIKGELVPCKNGYHLCRKQDLIYWLGPAIFEAEARGERVDADNKVVVREARLLRRVDTWNERTARLFACDCAERVLPIYEREHPNDKRPRQAIKTARRYADGAATNKELYTAYAAMNAARSARNATWSARDAAWAAMNAAYAAMNAAGSAAMNAAWEARDAAGAARNTVWEAEHEWQTARLFEYLGGEVCFMLG